MNSGNEVGTGEAWTWACDTCGTQGPVFGVARRLESLVYRLLRDAKLGSVESVDVKIALSGCGGHPGAVGTGRSGSTGVGGNDIMYINVTACKPDGALESIKTLDKNEVTEVGEGRKLAELHPV